MIMYATLKYRGDAFSVKSQRKRRKGYINHNLIFSENKLKSFADSNN